MTNPYDSEGDSVAKRGTRQGLKNIEARLTALFGPQASLRVERSDGRHTTCLRYPCARTKQEVRA